LFSGIFITEENNPLLALLHSGWGKFLGRVFSAVRQMNHNQQVELKGQNNKLEVGAIRELSYANLSLIYNPEYQMGII